MCLAMLSFVLYLTGGVQLTGGVRLTGGRHLTGGGHLTGARCEIHSHFVHAAKSAGIVGQLRKHIQYVPGMVCWCVLVC